MKRIHQIKSHQKLLGLGVVTAIIIAGCAGAPPTEQMAVSKVAVTTATSAGGNEFAPLAPKSSLMQEQMKSMQQSSR